MPAIKRPNKGKNKMSNTNPQVKKGMFITVVEWTSHRDNSYRGDCMEVVVVDENLVRVERINHYSNTRDKITLDLNRVIVRELSAEFVESCRPYPSDANAAA